MIETDSQLADAVERDRAVRAQREHAEAAGARRAGRRRARPSITSRAGSGASIGATSDSHDPTARPTHAGAPRRPSRARRTTCRSCRCRPRRRRAATAPAATVGPIDAGRRAERHQLGQQPASISHAVEQRRRPVAGRQVVGEELAGQCRDRLTARPHRCRVISSCQPWNWCAAVVGRRGASRATRAAGSSDPCGRARGRTARPTAPPASSRRPGRATLRGAPVGRAQQRPERRAVRVDGHDLAARGRDGERRRRVAPDGGVAARPPRARARSPPARRPRRPPTSRPRVRAGDASLRLGQQGAVGGEGDHLGDARSRRRCPSRLMRPYRAAACRPARERGHRCPLAHSRTASRS